jgi:preprotein translocase subunit SecG
MDSQEELEAFEKKTKILLRITIFLIIVFFILSIIGILNAALS